MVILLDPSIYELTNYEKDQPNNLQYSLQIQHLKFFENILDFIIDQRKNGCILSLALSNNQYNLICNPTSHPWNQYNKLTNKNSLFITYSKIMNLKPKIDDLQNYSTANPLDIIQECIDTNCFEFYCKHISYVYKNNLDYTIFYGRLNKYDKEILKYKLDNIYIDVSPIYDILDKYNSSIRKIYLSNPAYQTKPTTHNPFPNIELCRDYIDIRNKLLKDWEDKIYVYTRVGTEVVLRNNYHYNAYLSKINRNKDCIRRIFQSNTTPYVYASLDLRHGNLEVFDKEGHHIDEYTYDNIPQHKHDKTGRHDIIIKDTNF